MFKSATNSHWALFIILAAASFAARCLLFADSASPTRMRSGESQFHSRLAVRLLEDGPFAYSGWIDKLSMHPSANRPGAAQPPGTHILAAAAASLERLFYHGNRSLLYMAPATHVLLMAVV